MTSKLGRQPSGEAILLLGASLALYWILVLYIV